MEPKFPYKPSLIKLFFLSRQSIFFSKQSWDCGQSYSTNEFVLWPFSWLCIWTKFVSSSL